MANHSASSIILDIVKEHKTITYVACKEKVVSQGFKEGSFSASVSLLVQEKKLRRGQIRTGGVMLYLPGTPPPPEVKDIGFAPMLVRGKKKQEKAPPPKVVVKMIFTMENGDNLTLTQDSAKDLYAQLHSMFGEKS